MNLKPLLLITDNNKDRPSLQNIHGKCTDDSCILTCTDGHILVSLKIDKERIGVILLDSFGVVLDMTMTEFYIEKFKSHYFLKKAEPGEYPDIKNALTEPDNISIGEKIPYVSPENYGIVSKILYGINKNLGHGKTTPWLVGANHKLYIIIDTDFVKGIILLMALRVICCGDDEAQIHKQKKDIYTDIYNSLSNDAHVERDTEATQK
jgi:hypothetical protein